MMQFLKYAIKSWSTAAIVTSIAASIFAMRLGLTQETVSAGLTILSGLTWAVSAALPIRERQLSASLNFLAACWAALSGAFLFS
ncbi:MAG: hypothetical protein ABSC06_07240 [Rhodopila sp.]|jgi:hypothetical protein